MRHRLAVKMAACAAIFHEGGWKVWWGFVLDRCQGVCSRIDFYIPWVNIKISSQYFLFVMAGYRMTGMTLDGLWPMNITRSGAYAPDQESPVAS